MKTGSVKRAEELSSKYPQTSIFEQQYFQLSFEESNSTQFQREYGILNEMPSENIIL
jgi:hypothetical protein